MWKNIFNIYELKNAGKYMLNIMYTVFDLTHTDSSISTHSPVHYLFFFKKKLPGIPSGCQRILDPDHRPLV